MKASRDQTRAVYERRITENDEPYMNKPFVYTGQNDNNNYH